MFDANSEYTVNALLAPASRTASANGTGVDLKNYVGRAKVILHSAAAAAGTSPTLDVKIQDSADNSSFADLDPAVAFSQVTNAASLQEVSLDLDKVRRYVRAVATIGGTDTPTFVSSAVLIGRKQVAA